jgi:hypothetical protein
VIEFLQWTSIHPSAAPPFPCHPSEPNTHSSRTVSFFVLHISSNRPSSIHARAHVLYIAR